jgi:hypothetical protein
VGAGPQRLPRPPRARHRAVQLLAGSPGDPGPRSHPPGHITRFTDAGRTLQRLEQISDQSSASLKEAYDRASVRADSLLRLLPNAEFFKGLEALERAAAAETTPTPVIRRLDLVVLQAPR